MPSRSASPAALKLQALHDVTQPFAMHCLSQAYTPLHTPAEQASQLPAWPHVPGLRSALLHVEPQAAPDEQTLEHSAGTTLTVTLRTGMEAPVRYIEYVVEVLGQTVIDPDWLTACPEMLTVGCEQPLGTEADQVSVEPCP